MASETDWDSYRVAVVDVAPPGSDPFRIVPADPGSAGEWPEGLTSPVFVITAWNPDSIHLTSEENAARHEQLLADLQSRGVTWWTAVGRDPHTSHAEEGALVSGLNEEEALDLGRTYGQAAIFAWSTTTWQVVSCTDDRRHDSGWRLVDGPAAVS